MSFKLVAAIIAVAVPLCANAAEPPQLTDAQVLPIRPGINKLSDFLAGEPAVVTRAWRDNGDDHGFNVFTVMMPTKLKPADPGWDFVSFFTGGRERFTLTDAPHTVDDYVRSVRFLRGKVGGRAETLGVVAFRKYDKGQMPRLSAVPVAFQLYRLTERTEDKPIGPARSFALLAAWTTEKRYCNSEVALAAELKLPLPEDYAGYPLPDGCP